MMVEEALHPHGPIGAICAGCGKEIGMLEGSYYRKMPDDDIGQTFHSMCGDPFGIAAKVAAEREACAKIADDLARRWRSAAERVGVNTTSGKSVTAAAEGVECIALMIRARTVADTSQNETKP